MSDPEAYANRCILFGKLASRGKAGFLHWWYSPNPQLDSRSPRDLVDDGDLDRVIPVYESWQLEPYTKTTDEPTTTSDDPDSNVPGEIPSVGEPQEGALAD